MPFDGLPPNTAKLPKQLTSSSVWRSFSKAAEGGVRAHSTMATRRASSVHWPWPAKSRLYRIVMLVDCIITRCAILPMPPLRL